MSFNILRNTHTHTHITFTGTKLTQTSDSSPEIIETKDNGEMVSKIREKYFLSRSIFIQTINQVFHSSQLPSHAFPHHLLQNFSTLSASYLTLTDFPFLNFWEWKCIQRYDLLTKASYSSSSSLDQFYLKPRFSYLLIICTISIFIVNTVSMN